MNPYETIKYNKNFLSKVIVRLDFQHFVTFDSLFMDEIEKVIRKFFPIKGKKQIIRFNSVNVKFDARTAEVHEASSESEEGSQNEYLTKDEKNKFRLSNKYMVFVFNNYNTFDDLKNCIEKIITPFFSKITIPVERVGIRYINIFDSEQIKLQKNYFKADIAASLITKNPDVVNKLPIIRSMHLVEYQLETMKLNFRYGMFNPDYPNVLRKPSFTLDYDCYKEEIEESLRDVMYFLDNGHSAIQALFEESITDSLRKEMYHG